MNPFAYHRAVDVADASSALAAQPLARIIGGGTNLVDLMKEHIAEPKLLVDIGRLPLRAIDELPDGSLRLGALVTNADTAKDARVIKGWPLLSQAILAGASPQLRNMATNGGNLMQRTRCYYFYDVTTPCNKRTPGSGCPARDGYNRIHAVLGASHDCIAVHPSDMCVALAALDASIVVASRARGERTIPIAEFHRLPGTTPDVDTNLAHDEVITSIVLPPMNENLAAHSYYLKVRDRQSYAFALVSVAAALSIGPADGAITDVRLALGGVAHKPWRDRDVEAALVGQQPSKAVFEEAGEQMMKNAVGHGGNDFKIPLAKKAIVRAFERAARAGAASL